MDPLVVDSHIDLDSMEKKKAKLMARLQQRNSSATLKSNKAMTQKQCREFELDKLIDLGKQQAEQGIIDKQTISSLEEALSLECGVHTTRRIQMVLESLRKACIAKEKLPNLGDFSFKRSPKRLSSKPVLDELTMNNNNVSKETNLELRTAKNENIIDISNMTGKTSSIKGDNGSSLDLKNLRDCTLKFLFKPSAVHMHNIENCTLIFLPIDTSILMYNVTNCTVHACAQQIRVHDSIHINFHIGVVGAIIFEECKDMRLAPYRVLQNGQQVLPPSGDQWKRPSDFDWLAEGQSPNWRILPEADWGSMINI
ncbi:unnamed protein product [Auanema sp. JU1783]|nr:unnamed protein product [Auanema sp. JU1783]